MLPSAGLARRTLANLKMPPFVKFSLLLKSLRESEKEASEKSAKKKRKEEKWGSENAK